MNNENLRPGQLKTTKKDVVDGAKKSAKTNNLRKFWRDELLNMKEKDIQKYIDNPKNPYLNRVYAKMFLANADLDQYYKLANQIYGQPSQSIEVQGLPKLDLSVFGEEEDENKC